MVVACLAPLQLMDEELVARVRGGEVALFELVMRRYNQRLFRIARAALRDDSEAEDALQETWMLAFLRLGQLQQGARLGGWLFRIVMHEVRQRLRDRRLNVPLATELRSAAADPEQQAQTSRELQRLARAVDALPVGYRLVFVLREVEELSTSETAAVLGMREEAVKTRLHRARRLLQTALRREPARALFRFDGGRCDRLVRYFWQLVQK